MCSHHHDIWMYVRYLFFVFLFQSLCDSMNNKIFSQMYSYSYKIKMNRWTISHKKENQNHSSEFNFFYSLKTSMVTCFASILFTHTHSFFFSIQKVSFFHRFFHTSHFTFYLYDHLMVSLICEWISCGSGVLSRFFLFLINENTWAHNRKLQQFSSH